MEKPQKKQADLKSKLATVDLRLGLSDLAFLFFCFTKKERKRERENKREGVRERKTDRQTDRDRKTDRLTDRQTER